MLSSYLYLSLPYSGIKENSNLHGLILYNSFNSQVNRVDFQKVATGLAANASLTLL